MQNRSLVRLIFLLVCARPLRGEQVPFGIVYGPKAAFKITALHALRQVLDSFEALAPKHDE